MVAVQDKTPKVKIEDLLATIKTQQDQITALQKQITDQQGDITTIKEKHNETVGYLAELAKSLEKGGGGGTGLLEIAKALGALAPLIRPSSPTDALFSKLGIWTVKQALKGKVTVGKEAEKEIEQTLKEKAKEEE